MLESLRLQSNSGAAGYGTGIAQAQAHATGITPIYVKGTAVGTASSGVYQTPTYTGPPIASGPAALPTAAPFLLGAAGLLALL